MNKKISLILVAGLLVPGVVFAQMGTADASGFLQFVYDVVSFIVPLLVSAAIVYFLWGVLQFVSSGDDETKRSEGRHLMVNGVIAVFVMVSVWGLVSFLDVTLNLDDTQADAIDLQDITLP